MPESVAALADIDPECVALCDALNAYPGIQTIESCCGHGRKPYYIWFIASQIDDLAPVLYYFDRCHTGFAGWKVTVYTDCGMCRARFQIEGPVGAFDQATEIAGLLIAELLAAAEAE